MKKDIIKSALKEQDIKDQETALAKAKEMSVELGFDFTEAEYSELVSDFEAKKPSKAQKTAEIQAEI